MGQLQFSGLQIKGISAVVPTQCESNNDYTLLSESERKLLIKTIGVETRHVAPTGVTTSDLAIQAAKNLLDKLKSNPNEIDLLIFVTQSRDYYLPSTALIAQNKLNLPTTCMAFDIGLGCSGYIYGLSIVASLLKSSNWKKAILLAGDVSTISCSYNDKSTYPLFGDAGTATLIENTYENNKWIFDLNSDGSGEDDIKITHGCLRNLPTKDSFDEKERGDGIKRADLHLTLNGLNIFNFSITTIPKSVSEFLKVNSIDAIDFDYFVMHQANLLMNETIRKKLKIPPEKVPYSIKKYGNTSSASIPLTIVAELSELVSKKSNLLLSGFGVGLSWANAYIENNKIEALLLNEYSE